MSVIASTPVTALRGVGPKLAQKLADYGIFWLEDLLFHFPLRYQDRTRITPIAALREGDEAVVEGEVRAADVVFGRRRSLVVRLQDGSGTITLRFFHFSAAQKKSLSAGSQLRCFGQARRGRGGIELFHPEYRQLRDSEDPVEEQLTPIYPTTEGIGQSQWRKLCAAALTQLAATEVEDLLPDAADMSIKQAIQLLHAPPPDTQVALLREGQHPAQLRLALEELVAHQLSLQQLRDNQRRYQAPPCLDARPLLDQFLSLLPFTPTAAQQGVNQDISRDLSSDTPMLRLVQGDVGSGKTLVAACAALQVIGSGYQVALMAPTEILSEQHRDNFRQWFEPLGIHISWLTGRSKGKKRDLLLAGIASGEAQLIIGTHALFQDDVQFDQLGLVIVDEQHRFGVHQRLALATKNKQTNSRPHQLIMTATPIPRTLSMVAYADLDCSVIDELPPGRQPVETALIDSGRREQVVQRVAAACAQGRQAYWVCTLIEESDKLQAQAAQATAEELAQALPGLRVGLVHGRLKADEKAGIMQQFNSGDIHLLVATTVIEVGVDVPNASLMIIENPERLGLAQLHQLRGRVGRGSQASACVLLYQTPLSPSGKQRLQVMRESNDGFYIAEQDLQLRGPGEVLGTRQTGLMNFRVARLPDHECLFDQVERLSHHIHRKQPGQAAKLIERWTGKKQQYAQV